MLEERDQWGQALRRRTAEQEIPVPTSTPCHAELPGTHSVLHQTTHLPSATNRSWSFSNPCVDSVFPAVLGMVWTPTLLVARLRQAVLPDSFGQEWWLWINPVRFPLPFNWGETFRDLCKPESSTAGQGLLAGFCVSSCAFNSYLAVRIFQRWCLHCLYCADEGFMLEQKNFQACSQKWEWKIPCELAQPSTATCLFPVGWGRELEESERTCVLRLK